MDVCEIDMYTTRVAIATGRDSAIILVIVFFVTEHYLLLQREREREREIGWRLVAW